MISELRDTMQRQAETVTPKPDPYRRLMIRRSRRRTVVAATVATMLLSLAAPAGVLMSRNGFGWDASRLGGSPPAELQPLLNSRTRGSLGGDAAFLQAMRERAAESGVEAMPGDPDAIRVLFAGDVADCGRVVVLAAVTSRPIQVTYAGGLGEGPEALRLSGSGPLSAVAQPSWVGPNGPYQLIFGPEGSWMEVSVRTRYLRDGPMPDWRPVEGDAYLASGAATAAGTRVKVSMAGLTPVEIHASAVRAVPAQQIGVDEESLRGHGEGVRRAAQEAAMLISRRTGLTASDAKFVLLWGGEVEMRNLSRPSGPMATVMAVTPDGGGPYATVAVDPVDTKVAPFTHPTGEGAIGDPARSIIVHRLPYGAPVGGVLAESDELFIIAPPTAVQAKLVQGGSVARVALHNGVGRTKMSAKLILVVRALDAADAVVAEAAFEDVP